MAVGISAGVGALVSAIPSLQPYTLLLCLAILLLIAIINLRGVRESGGALIIPTYLFVFCLFTVIIIGIIKTILSDGHPTPVAAPPILPPAMTAVSLWLLLQAFSSGCTAMTGVEAVSNGVTAFREPTVKNARRTLTLVIVILALLLAGISYLSKVYGIGATTPGQIGYQSVISQLIAAVVGKGFFYFLSIATTLMVLALSANTGFADFPRLCKSIAQNGYLPRTFASRGRRLVYSQGIYVITFLSGLLLIVFNGITDHLIPLFAVGAFLAFTLSQAGMVFHWIRVGGPHKYRYMFINGIGALATGCALVVIFIAKFAEGAWITALLIPIMLMIFTGVRRHYHRVEMEITSAKPLDPTGIHIPIVIIPMNQWNKMSQKGMCFALKISPDIIAVQVNSDENKNDLHRQWPELVEEPAQAAGLPISKLMSIHSPYRHVINPIIDFIFNTRAQNPDRQIVVLVPELVAYRWYHHLLHNKRASLLKALLFLRGDHNIIVINAPWYLSS